MTASEHEPLYRHAVDVCWAVAARDAAIEQGDAVMAAMFAGEARAAIDTALDAGVTLAELAEELDYPGGEPEMDGPHIDRQIAGLTDNRPAAEQGAPMDAREGGRLSWLEISEVGFSDGTVVEVLHGSPEMVAAAWAEPRMADLDAHDGDTDPDHQVAQAATLRKRFAAARHDAVSPLVGEDNTRGEDDSTAGQEASARCEHGLDRRSDTTDAGLGT